MNRVNRITLDIDVVVNVYDPNKPDVDKKLLMTYESPKQAAQGLGISLSILNHNLSRKNRFYSPHLNLEVCVREKPKTADMKFRFGILQKKKVLN